MQFLYFVLGTSLLWGSTVAFTYLKVKSAKCLFTSGGLDLWSCCFGLGVGLVSSGLGWSCYFGCDLNHFVLFTSLAKFGCCFSYCVRARKRSQNLGDAETPPLWMGACVP